MSTVLNTTAVVPMTFLDSSGTGKTGLTVTATARLTGSATTISAVVTERGSGQYDAAFTPNAVGTWYLSASTTIDGDAALWTEEVDVITAAQSTFPTATGADYATLAELKAQLSRDDAQDDTYLSATITRVSRAIDGYCNRRFYQIAATARYYTADTADVLFVDDLVSVTEVAVDVAGLRDYATVWGVTDYDLTPDNAADTGYPYTAIRQRPFTSRWFPTLRRGCRITGTWGWPAVPDAITAACVLQSVRIFKRRDTPYGIAGSADLGMQTMIPKIDPDVRAFLDPYRRITASGI